MAAVGGAAVGEHGVIMSRATAAFAALCETHEIDESHGVKHASAVLAHAERALAAASPSVSAERALSVMLAALLHDADDRKYFGKESAKAMINASRIMAEAGAPAAVIADSRTMISLVSCSANGNSCPPECAADPSLLWPRWADRLEAAGEIGVARCYLHNHKAGKPLSCSTTPRPRTEEEAFALATEERFAAYQSSGGHSDSMLDHYYDKLLQVARPAPELVRNAYLEEEAKRRAAPLLAVCLAYAETKRVPLETIEAMVASCGLQVPSRSSPTPAA